jgi:ABC-type sugar transport system permease subunit
METVLAIVLVVATALVVGAAGVLLMGLLDKVERRVQEDARVPGPPWRRQHPGALNRG